MSGSSNLVVSTLHNKGMQCKIVIFNNKPRLSIEDFSNGKPQSLLNIKLPEEGIHRILDVIKKIKVDNKPQSEMITFNDKNEQGNLVMTANYVITQTQNNLIIITITSQRGNFDFPLLLTRMVSRSSEPLSDAERSISQLNMFERELEIGVKFLFDLKAAKYLEYIKANPPSANFMKGGNRPSGGGGGWNNQKQDGYGQGQNQNNQSNWN